MILQIQVYFLTLKSTIKATKDFKIGQLLFQIDYEFIFDHQIFLTSNISKYLSYLSNKMVENQISGWQILDSYSSSVYIEQLIREDSNYYLAPVLYLFENKYMSRFKDDPAWKKDYFELLPQDYSCSPCFYYSLIKKYHPQFSQSQKKYYQSLKSSFQFMKDLIVGKKISQLHTFQQFLKSTEEDWQYYYQIYCQQFNFQNYFWAYFTWTTRAFDKNKTVTQKSIKVSSVLSPITDMINHSFNLNNIFWHFQDQYRKMQIICSKNISEGDQLYFEYGQRCIMSFYQKYGFLQIEDKSVLTMKFSVGKEMKEMILQKMPINPSQNHCNLNILATNYPQFIPQQIFAAIKYKEVQSQTALNNLLNDCKNNYFTKDQLQILNNIVIILQSQIAICKKITK